MIFHLCSIEGCDKPRVAKTYCNMHYRRLKNHDSDMSLGHKEQKGINLEASNGNWKGDLATKGAGRGRARLRFPLGPCQRCGKEGIDRHHKDGNTLNNNPENILILCRLCHMKEDGRMESFSKILHQQSIERAINECGHGDWKQCKVCHKWDDPQNLYINKKNVYHKICNSSRLKQLYLAKKRKEDIVNEIRLNKKGCKGKVWST